MTQTLTYKMLEVDSLLMTSETKRARMYNENLVEPRIKKSYKEIRIERNTQMKMLIQIGIK